eukprot:751499-Hanusia_phi.AAC.1
MLILPRSGICIQCDLRSVGSDASLDAFSTASQHLRDSMISVSDLSLRARLDRPRGIRVSPPMCRFALDTEAPRGTLGERPCMRSKSCIRSCRNEQFTRDSTASSCSFFALAISVSQSALPILPAFIPPSRGSETVCPICRPASAVLPVGRQKRRTKSRLLRDMSCL